MNNPRNWCISILIVLLYALSSCGKKAPAVSYAVIKYEREAYRKHIYIPVVLKAPEDVRIIANAMAAKQIVSAKFPRKQYLTIVYADSGKQVFSVNEFVLRDTSHCYIIPEGPVREKFVQLIKANEPLPDSLVTPADKLSVRKLHPAVEQ